MSREEVKDACIRDEGMASLIQFRCRSILSRFKRSFPRAIQAE
jgi:hypothetical protein